MNSTSSLVPFSFEGRQIRVFSGEQGEPWFVAADVCSALSIGNVSQALSRLDADEKTLISNEGAAAGGPQSLNLINEPGLYTLVLGSRKPEARRFKRWVTQPYCRHGHSGYQSLWNPAVLDVVRELG